jgi:uncharacterized protein (TIGR02172 family)
MTMEKGAQIGQGRTADVYAWGEDRILKLYQDWMPRHLVEQEYAVTRAAQACGVPVPATEEVVDVDGRVGIVFERVRGPSILKEIETKPWTMGAVVRQMAELHAQIHACSVPSGLPSQRAQIENGIDAAKDLPEAQKEVARRHLAQFPEGDRLCHGDFHPGNILVSDHGPVIIDWFTGTRGNPLADVSRTSLLFSTGGLPPQIPRPAQLVINASRALMYRLYLRRYLQLRPAGRREIEAWDLPLVAARLREVEGYPREKAMLIAQLEALLSRQMDS